MQPVRTAVIGASGYGGQELIRYLARHPIFELVAVTSRQHAGQSLAGLFPGLQKKLAGLKFVDLGADTPELATLADLYFLALPHGAAAPYALALRQADKIVVDLSADFRTTNPVVYQEFYEQPHPAPQLLAEAVYGLPEIHRERLKIARLIAAPGCFPTSILLPLIPFLRASEVELDSIVVASLSGVSGAGRKLEMRLLFGEVVDNFHAYGVPRHRHLGEIEQELSLAAGIKVTISFVPHLVPVHRGMTSTVFAKLKQPRTDVEVRSILETAYGQEPFVELLVGAELPQAKAVAGSNRIQICARVDARTQRLFLFSSIDNLGKGNAAQAIQAANLAVGLSETSGLE